MFIAKAYRGPRSGVEKDKASGTAVLNGAILVRTTGGNVTPATSSSVKGDVEGVATQAITAGQALTKVHVLTPGISDTFVADTTNDSSAAHNNQRMILTDSVTVNNTGTDAATGLVEQIAPVGTAANRKILVKFVLD